MKRHELLFSISRIPLDFLSIYLAFFLARNMREFTDGIPGVILPIQTIHTQALSSYALIGALLYILLLTSHRMYSFSLTNSKIGEILDLIRYGIYWFLFYSVGVYLGRGIFFSGPEIPRLVILYSMILGVIGSIIFRFVINSFQDYLLKKGKIKKRNLLLISGSPYEEVRVLLRDIRKAKIYHIAGYANPEKLESYNFEWYQKIKNIETLFSQRKVDEILFISSMFSKKEEYEIWELARIYGIRYRMITNNFDITKTNTELSLIHRTPVIEIKNTPLENWNRIIKRGFDIFLSLGIILLFSPLFLLIGILIKLEDPSGPIIYRNLRLGQKGKTFDCYKFRYLKWKYCVKESYGIDNKHDPAIEFEKRLIENNNARTGPLYKIHNDPRKTKIGHFLEKYSLDELPQFFNVLRGDMSIIGPRPHQPREVAKYKKYQKRLLTIKPGITGMAQVNGREQNNFDKEAKLDLFYIENWSFLLDLKIMFKTLAIILQRK